MCVCKRNWQFQQMVSCTPQCQSPHLDAHWFLRDTRLCSDTLTCLQARARRCVDLLWTNEGRKHEAQHRLTPLNLLFKHIETSQKLSAQKNEQDLHALPVSALIKVMHRPDWVTGALQDAGVAKTAAVYPVCKCVWRHAWEWKIFGGSPCYWKRHCVCLGPVALSDLASRSACATLRSMPVSCLSRTPSRWMRWQSVGPKVNCFRGDWV